MSNHAEPTIDLLIQEAAWLRRLAGHLVRDPGAADDVVQETWMAALAGRASFLAAAGAGARRGWLATVARRSAGRHARSAMRRGDAVARAVDESAQAAAAAELDPALVAERMDLQQEVAEALRQVAEPYRSTLFHLYYEGRTAAELARSLGIPEATVRTRAHRGRALLRERLVADSARDWKSWTLALAPWAGKSAQGVSLASKSSQVARVGAAAIVILAGALTATWSLTRPGGAQPGESAVARTESGSSQLVAPSAVPTAGAQAAPERASVRPAAALPETAADVDPVLVMGEVTDASGTAIGGAYLTLENESEVRTVRSGVDDGTWVLPTVAPGRWRLTVFLKGFRPVHQEIEVGQASPHIESIRLVRSIRIPIRFVDGEGQALVGPTLEAARSHQVLGRPVTDEERGLGATEEPRARRGFGRLEMPILYPGVVATAENPGARIQLDRTARVKRYGVGEWREREQDYQSLGEPISKEQQGILELVGDLPVWVSVVYGDQVLESRRVGEVPEELVFQVTQAGLRALHGKVRFAVIDPASGQNVSAEYLTARASLRVDNVTPTWTGLEDGLVTLYEVPPGPHRVHVGHQRSPHALVAFECRVFPDDDALGPPVTLLPAVPFELTIVDAEGAPVQASIRAHRQGEAASKRIEDWTGYGRTDARGRATVHAQPEGPVALVVTVSAGRGTFVRSIDTRETRELRIEIPDMTRVRFRRHADERNLRADIVDASGLRLNAFGLLSGRLALVPGDYAFHRRTAEGSVPAGKLIVRTDPLVVDPSTLR